MNHKSLILADWLVIVAGSLFSIWLMFSTFSYQDGNFVIQSKLYSDFAAHLPLIRSFSWGDNLPVQYPTFAHAPIRYHFLFYALVAGLEKLGLNLAFALNLISALGFALLLIMIYRFGRLVSSRTAGVLAIWLFLFNGSLSFVRFFQTHPLGSETISKILTNSAFPSFGPWDGSLVAAFWNLNIYTNQRHLGLSYALTLIVLYPFVRALYVKSRPRWPMAVWLGLIGLFLPWLHQAAAVILLWLLPVIFVLNFRRLKSHLPWLLVFCACLLPGLAYYGVLGGSQLAYHLGFLAQDITPRDLTAYWFYNLGLYLPLLPFIFLAQGRPGRSLLAAASGLFIGANLIRLSPDIINNHKLVNFFMLIVCLYTASWLVSLWRKQTWSRWFIPPLVIGLTLSGLIDFFPVKNDYALKVPDLPQSDIIRWIAQTTPRDSVFLTTVYLYNPASLAGRKTFVDYGYFNWSMGYVETARRQALSQLFSPVLKPDQVCRLLEQWRLDYILVAPEPGALGQINPHFSTLVKSFRPAFTSAEGYTVYAVAQNCHNEPL